jgi:citrate lyase subunit beta/citryl-CoA lyase
MAVTIRPRRSALYVPGSNARALEKARSLDADALILDLEDSVAPDAKAAARRQVAETVASGGFGHREIAIRCNGLPTEWAEADVAMIARSGASAMLVPKVSAAGDLEDARAKLSKVGAPEGLALWAMIETPLAILNAREIAGAARHSAHPLEVLILGTNDLAKETRTALVEGRQPMLAWLTTAVIAARAYGLDVIDGVYNAFQDSDGFREECLQGRTLGMDGKTLIHPGQIATANEVFAPSAEEVAAARKIIAAFEQPENQGKGAITVDGRMVELLHRDMALRTIALDAAIRRAATK